MTASTGLWVVIVVCAIFVFVSVARSWHLRGKRPPTAAPCPYVGIDKSTNADKSQPEVR